jgi:H+/gluconate symporter-like permease
MLTSILILSLFLVIAILMITRKLPTLLALPILAVGVALIAGVPLVLVQDKVDTGILKHIIEGGATRLASAYISVIMGAWLGQLMNHTGVSKTIVKGAAELGGDRPFLVTVLITVAIAVLFTTISGLGAVIMIATIAIPIMISVGVPALTAACMFLFGMATGIMVNMTNWAFYATATGVKQADVQSFAFILCGLTALTSLIFAIVEFKRAGIKFAWASQANLGTSTQTELKKAPILALFTPVIPILLVVGLKWPIIPAFLIGVIWCAAAVFIFSPDRNLGNLVSVITKSAFEGVSDSAPAVLLMVGIGMVLNSLMHPMVSASITPLIKAIVPTSAVGYVLFFAILAPLALYRGPLNMWGLGSGIAAVIIGLKILPAPAVFSAFLSTERVQAIGDPTNTHNVWLANYVGEDVNKILLKVLPYIWGIALIGIIIAAVMWI